MKNIDRDRVFFGKGITTVLGFSGLAVLGAALSADQSAESLWTTQRMNAVVRIEVKDQRGRRSVGSAFLVKGKERNYIVTSVHVLYGRGASTEASKSCIDFKSSVDFYRRDRDVEKLAADNCAWMLGSDLALVPLPDREQGYPTLGVRARNFYQFDKVFLAGYPNGYSLDPTRAGKVSSLHGENDLVVSDVLTMEGMSGGPYLSSTGNVVGVHSGGVPDRSGFAHFVSLMRAKSLLEPYLGPLEEEKALAPDRDTVVQEAATEAGLGTLFALRAVKDPDQRLKVWEVFSGEAATPDEVELIKSLPTAQFSNLPAGTLGPLTQAMNSDQDQGRNRLAIGKSLNTINVQSQFICQSEAMKISEGVLYCNGVANYLPTEKMGQKIDPQLIIMHTTMTKGLKEAVSILLNNSVKASVHFLIDRDGSVVQLVPTDRSAWHAGGLSAWKDLKGLNKNSIGIDFINLGQLDRDEKGRFFTFDKNVEIPVSDVQEIKGPLETTYWHRFTGQQLVSAQALASQIATTYKIRAIAGHCNVLPGRKSDPGPAFPLSEFGQAVLGRGEPDCAPEGSRH